MEQHIHNRKFILGIGVALLGRQNHEAVVCSEGYEVTRAQNRTKLLRMDSAAERVQVSVNEMGQK